MDQFKVSLLFDKLPDWADPDDREDRAALFSEQLDIPEDASSGDLFRLLLHETVAAQIADEDPPEVWAAAQRLIGFGLDRERILHNLTLALLPSIRTAMAEDVPFDAAAYVAALDRLPVPAAAEIEETLVAITRERQPIEVDELERLTAARLGFALDEEPFEMVLEGVSDEVMDPEGPLALLAGDLVVEPASLCSDVVLTHRLEEAEREIGILTVSVDLVGFGRAEAPTLGPGREPLNPFSVEDGHLAWHGPDGWLDRYQPGDLLAVRMSGETVTLEVLRANPPLDRALVAALRAVYDREIEEPGLPVATEDLLLGLLADDPGRFAAPQAPLEDLIDAAGLELQGGYVAHDPEVWGNLELSERIARVVTRLDDEDDVSTALEILEWFESGEDDPDRLRHAAAALEEPEVLDVVADELLGSDEDPDSAQETLAFAERLLGAASRQEELAPARFLLAVASERLGDTLAAEGHLHLAVEANGTWEPALDRLAWYLSDRGRAADAARLWRQAGLSPKHNQDLRTVEPFTRTGGSKLGRNEPCWCGSGRKYKNCHLGQPATAPLPDRVGWLCRKAAAYLERRGGRAEEDVFHLASARAGRDASARALERALDDPIIIDLALTEGGWFSRFLDERGVLLPDDEALLATSWLMVDRSVYEIIDTRAGVGLTLRDLRSGEEVAVRERTFSRQAKPGTLLCARAVPDGETHQLVGGLFPVNPGREAELLDLLDEADPEALAEYVGALERPPTLVTRENEPLVACKAVLAVRHPKTARDVLDVNFEAEEPGTWVEMHALNPDERILRATLHLTGSRLTVETTSEARLDRVLTALRTELPDLVLVSDDRRPLRPGELPPVPGHLSGPPLAEADLRAASDEIQEQLERRWCDENVPALGGLTPRQAAADPTRRETLERLLVQFEQMHEQVPAGAITMRPGRLRQLLDLDR